MAGLYNRTYDQVEGNKPGYGQIVYLSKTDNFTSIKKPATPYTNPEDEYTIGTAHTFASGDGFNKVYNLTKQLKIDGSTIGEMGALNNIEKATLFIPGDGAKTLALVKDILNAPLIALFKDPDTANGYVQLGSEDFPAQVDANSFKSDQVYDGMKGYTVEISAPNKFFYTSTVTVAS